MTRRLLLRPEEFDHPFSRELHRRTLREFGFPIDFSQDQAERTKPVPQAAGEVRRTQPEDVWFPCSEVDPSNDAARLGNGEVGAVLEKPVSSSNPPVSSYSVSLDDVLEYYRGAGVVGEERNCILQTLCAVVGQPFGIEGGSGSGKSYLADALVRLLPKGSVYTLELATDTALFYDSHAVNRARFLYIPELQKVMGRRQMNIIEAVKNLTEGKSINRITARPNGRVNDHVIEGEITVFYTLARENDFKKDTETARRFLQIQTDESPGQVRRILEYKARQRMGSVSEPMPVNARRTLAAHVGGLIRSPVETVDPYAGIVLDRVPLLNKAKGFINHYLRLVDASASFHRNERLRTDGGKLIVDIADHRLIYDLYFPAFLKCVYELEGKPVPEPPVIEWDLAQAEAVRSGGGLAVPSWPAGRSLPRVYDCARLMNQAGAVEDDS